MRSVSGHVAELAILTLDTFKIVAILILSDKMFENPIRKTKYRIAVILAIGICLVAACQADNPPVELQPPSPIVTETAPSDAGLPTMALTPAVTSKVPATTEATPTELPLPTETIEAEAAATATPNPKRAAVLTRQADDASNTQGSSGDDGKVVTPANSGENSPEVTSVPEATPTPFLPTIDYPAATERDLDPVVMTGVDIEALTGILPEQIAGFRFDGSTWTQIPIQVDERAWVDLRNVRGRSDPTDDLVALLYTDAETRVGADPRSAL